MTKLILDACCGSRMFWFDKNNPNAEFVDIREFDHEAIWKGGDGKPTRYCSIHPTTKADFTKLPFADESFYHVVFDPPHLTSLSPTSWMAKKYGRLGDDWQTLIHGGFCECMRVLKPYGTLIFKWNEYDIPVKEILSVIGADPLYGHKSGKQQKTHWMCFMKTGCALEEKKMSCATCKHALIAKDVHVCRKGMGVHYIHEVDTTSNHTDNFYRAEWEEK